MKKAIIGTTTLAAMSTVVVVAVRRFGPDLAERGMQRRHTSAFPSKTYLWLVPAALGRWEVGHGAGLGLQGTFTRTTRRSSSATATLKVRRQPQPPCRHR